MLTNSGSSHPVVTQEDNAGAMKELSQRPKSLVFIVGRSGERMAGLQHSFAVTRSPPHDGLPRKPL